MIVEVTRMITLMTDKNRYPLLALISVVYICIVCGPPEVGFYFYHFTCNADWRYLIIGICPV